MESIFYLIIALLILVLIPFLLGNLLTFFLKFITKNEKFLRSTKYVIFGFIFLLELLLVVQVYIKRGVRARIKQPFYMDQSIEKSERLKRLNELKTEGKIKDDLYEKVVKYLESE